MPWFITSISSLGARQICAVAHDTEAEAQMHAALVAFTNPGQHRDLAVEEMEQPSGVVPVPMAFEAKRRKGK